MNLTSKFVIALTIVLCILVAWLFSGCASVTVNPTTGEVSYLRIGNQSISDLKIRTPDGWEISFDADSKTEALKTALGIAAAMK
jgi:hypothetical protein